jgi:hypothetical protein
VACRETGKEVSGVVVPEIEHVTVTGSADEDNPESLAVGVLNVA